MEASQVYQKSYRQLNTSVENQIDDFKRAVEDNKKGFHSMAPYAVDKSIDNVKALEKLQEFRQAC